MGKYVFRRFLMMIPVLLIGSVLVFVVIQLPPGDIIDAKIKQLEQRGLSVSPEAIASLRSRYDIDKPVMVQYLLWFGNILRGDFSYSMLYNKPVSRILKERLPFTALMAIISFILLNAMALSLIHI